MARRIENDQGHMTYHTFDDRLISRAIIENAIRQIEAQKRRREFLEHVRRWSVLALVVCLVAAVTILLWLHLL